MSLRSAKFKLEDLLKDFQEGQTLSSAYLWSVLRPAPKELRLTPFWCGTTRDENDFMIF